ncbi:MAG: hypothetical protein KDC87_14210, partial [Planctomycetes bacterium]|nr:hypothetical protein [Planctomycetota bacterium]
QDPHGKQDAHAKGGHGKDGGHDSGKGEHGAGKHKTPKVEYVEGPSIKEQPKADDGHGGGHRGGHGGDQGDGHDGKQNGHGDKVLKTPTKPGEKTPEEERQDRMRRDFERRKEWLHTKGASYSGPGDLFEMPRLQAPLSVAEVNSTVHRAQQMMEEIKQERAALAKMRRDLEIRYQDIADRQKSVSKLMNEVEAKRLLVERTIEDFNKRVLELRVDEEAGLKEVARTIGTLSPQAAKQLILNYWRTPDGQDKAVKILAVMEKERVDQIIAQMDTEQMRQVLEKRMTIARTGQRK